MQKFRTRRILTPATAPILWRAGRIARMGGHPRPDTGVERFLFDKAQVMAAPIPKVASRTIQGMFETLNGRPDGWEVYLQPQAIRSRYQNYYIFSFVRNPWSRIYSCWKDKIADAVTPGKVSILSRFAGLRPFMPFDDFVRWLETPEGADDRADRHWMSQVRHLDDGAGGSFCDFVGRIEALEDGFRAVEAATGLTLPRSEQRNAKTRTEEYLSAYNDETKKIVARRYGADIDRYNYRFEG
ncbi:MAG: sulfotransferase family protein [Pseudomonadota bacterium]